jgi:phosphodiesterase/alkaline phosphatase D-like protein
MNDYAGETVDPARFAAGAQAFLEWLPVRQERGDPPFRTHRRVRWGRDVELFFLDGRQHRSAERFCNATLPDGPQTSDTLFSPFVTDEEIAAQLLPANLLSLVTPLLTPSDPTCAQEVLGDPARTLLGTDQIAWLKQALLDSTALFKIVINDVPISSLLVFPYDRWEAYTAERDALLAFLGEHFDPDHLLFLTTDFHMNLALQRAELTEVVVGPIATNTFGRELIERIPPNTVGDELVFLLLDAMITRANGGEHLGSAYDAFAYALVETFDDAGETRLRLSVRGDPDYLSGANDPDAVQELFSFELPRP